MPHHLVRRRYGFNPYAVARTAGRAVGFARQAWNYRNKFTRMNRGGGSKTDAPKDLMRDSAVTRFGDSRTLYVKKTRGRRRRKVWRKFVKKVRAVNEKDRPTTCILRTDQYLPACIANNQAVITVPLFSIANSSGAAWNDMKAFLDVMNQLADITEVRQKYYIKYGNMDVSVSNTSSKNMLVDAYWCIAQRDCKEQPDQLFQKGVIQQSMTFTQGEVDTSTLGGGVDTVTPGVTPFQAPTFCRYWKIYKKSRYNLPPGGNLELQMTDHKRRFHDGDPESYFTNPLSSRKGWTKHIMFIIRAYPTAHEDSPTITDPVVSGDVIVTRIARYAGTPVDQDNSNYFVAY